MKNRVNSATAGAAVVVVIAIIGVIAYRMFHTPTYSVAEIAAARARGMANQHYAPIPNWLESRQGYRGPQPKIPRRRSAPAHLSHP